MFAPAFVFFLASGLLSGPQDQKEPNDVLKTLEEDLKKGIAAGGTNKDVRDKLAKIAKTAFDKELGSSASKTSKSAWEYQTEFLDHITVADSHFRGESEKVERGIWISACRALFSRQLQGCKESSLTLQDGPTTEKVYNDLATAVNKVGSRFARGAVEFDKAGYDSAKQTFAFLILKAKAPPGDPKSTYAKQLLEVDRLYPLTSEDQKKLNTDRNGILKSAARSAFDRAMSVAK